MKRYQRIWDPTQVGPFRKRPTKSEKPEQKGPGLTWAFVLSGLGINRSGVQATIFTTRDSLRPTSFFASGGWSECVCSCSARGNKRRADRPRMILSASRLIRRLGRHAGPTTWRGQKSDRRR